MERREETRQSDEFIRKGKESEIRETGVDAFSSVVNMEAEFLMWK